MKGDDVVVDKTQEIEKEIREFHKYWLAVYIARVIETINRTCGNENASSYNAVYNSCQDVINYTNEEKEEIYELVDNILEEKYMLLFAHKELDKPIYLVDLNEEVEKC